MRLSLTKYLSVFFLLCFFVIGKAQYDIPERPTSDQSLIFDYAETSILSSEEKTQLNQELIQYEGTTSTQVALVIVQSLKGEEINLLATEWAHKWGVGQKGKDNGLIILLSVDDRKVSIQNGYGLEEYMTDAMSRRIIANYMIPYFKKGNYYEGLQQGLTAIMNVLDGKFVEDGSNDAEGSILPFLFILGFIILFIIIASKGGRGGGNSFGGGRRGRNIIFTDFGSSGWSGRSSGGFGGGSGGFGGFGGGGFGGGGASGSW
ncbi:TPM domain-containing protein [Weeksellaceae bacterium TAE3-ERU29]|nr:TPM domain-containing protein [Weeksellaceae bacterium TAE3-ERU29]